jgi:hypothetical protein
MPQTIWDDTELMSGVADLLRECEILPPDHTHNVESIEAAFRRGLAPKKVEGINDRDHGNP